MKDQEYWIIISRNLLEQAKFNPRAFEEDLGNGKVKVYWGHGYLAPREGYAVSRDLTIEEDKEIIRGILQDRNVSEFNITTQ